MDREILRDFLNNRHDNTRQSTLYVMMWCRRQWQQYIEKYMDDSNYKFFMKWIHYDGCPITNFHYDGWYDNDKGVFETIQKDIVRHVEYTNKNIRIIAKFCRMVYFTKYIGKGDVSELMFDDIYSLSFDDKRTSKRHVSN